jgi:hypothetical protein
MRIKIPTGRYLVKTFHSARRGCRRKGQSDGGGARERRADPRDSVLSHVVSGRVRGGRCGPSRLTDSRGLGELLEALPADVDGICAFARERTIHHNLVAARGLPARQFVRVWPPFFPDVLRSSQRGPVLGGCVLESYFLAGLLRHRGFEARIRAGYFRDIRSDGDQVVEFWRRVAVGKGRTPDDARTRGQNEIDHRIEHWICEVREAQEWTFLDANTDFLREHSGLEVPFRLPHHHFEYAHEAWGALAAGAPPARYAEEPRAGDEHVRRQLLLDFFSLLNHDLADVDVLSCDDSTYDSLARLLARDPSPADLVGFYRTTPELALATAEDDPYSLV